MTRDGDAKELFILGKYDKDQYNLRVAYPLSLRVGAAIVLSSLDFKWCSQ